MNANQVPTHHTDNTVTTNSTNSGRPLTYFGAPEVWQETFSMVPHRRSLCIQGSNIERLLCRCSRKLAAISTSKPSPSFFSFCAVFPHSYILWFNDDKRMSSKRYNLTCLRIFTSQHPTQAKLVHVEHNFQITCIRLLTVIPNHWQKHTIACSLDSKILSWGAQVNIKKSVIKNQ